MGQANRFYKSFLVFANEDDGFSSSGAPSGYARILVRDGKGVIDLNVHSLKENSDKLTYRLYIMKNAQDSFMSVCMGIIPVHKNKASIQWEFDADNVEKTGMPAEEFNAAAIQAEEVAGGNVRFKYPLSSCKSGDTAWKKLLDEASSTIKEEAEERGIVADEDKQSICGDVSEAANEPCEAEANEAGKNKTLETPHCCEDDSTGSRPQELKEEKEEMHSACPACIEGNISIAHTPDKAEDLEIQYPNMGTLRSNFNGSFELYDPFGSNRKDYKWWKVNNPVQLGNIFHQSGIKAPFFFNPLVMMAHYKYRYLIVGIYEDKIKNRDYMVCGIPGVYGVDDKPFGDLCRWVQIEGSKPRYGAFGYWLIYMEPDTGKILEFR